MLNLKNDLRLVKEQRREPTPSFLVGIGLRTAHLIWGKCFQLLNSCTNVKTEIRSFFVRFRKTYVLKTDIEDQWREQRSCLVNSGCPVKGDSQRKIKI